MNEIIVFLRGIIPTEIQMIWGAGCSVAGSVAGYLLGWNGLVETLLAAMAIDYATGVLAAYRYKRKHPVSKRGPNSRIGALGIIRKVSILCIVALAHYLDAAMGTSAVHTVVIWFYIGNEGLSIIENAGKAGAPIPKRLTETLEQLAKEKNAKGTETMQKMQGRRNDA